jgi:sulfatase modifying factor 1
MKPILSFVLLFASVVSAPAITIDMVTVGNPGNAPDTRYISIGVGSVGYNYQIGKYEITAGQYTEFLNAVAKDDANLLYTPAMTSDGNIVRNGSSPNYSYSVTPDWANRPVSNVDFWDAARFANWLHNGQPTGAQGPGTTEDGAYHDIGNDALFGRNAGARFFIPTEDEWYKAAYHDKSAGLAASYFDYPTGTNSVPGRNVNETSTPGNNANYYTSSFTIGPPYYSTPVGEFELSVSPYGTFDQGGNIYEWNETSFNTVSHIARGGAFDWGSIRMNASLRDGFGSPYFSSWMGFRVASIAVPEPSTLLLIITAFATLLMVRRR